MNLPDLKQRPEEEYRQLRVITILAFLLATALLLPHGVIAERPLPAMGIAPMFFSAAMGVLVFTGMLRLPRTKASMDLILAVVLLIFMVPRCVVSHRITLCGRRTDHVPFIAVLCLSDIIAGAATTAC